MRWLRFDGGYNAFNMEDIMGFLKTFTERHAQPMDRYTYDLAQNTRDKMLHILAQRNGSVTGGAIFLAMLDEVQRELLKGVGSQCLAAGSSAGHPMINYFLTCSTDHALSFIELCLHTAQFTIGRVPNDVVEDLNRTLEADGVGFELTQFRQVWRPTGPDMKPMPQGKMEFPRFIKKGDRTAHELAVKPALEVLSEPRFATANQELLKAFDEVRKGDYADAITDCGSAFESVLKTICQEKGWTIDPDKDTCKALVETCRKKNLFEPFYVEIFVGVGRVRNKMGDAHGKAGTPEYKATSEHAEHMIAMTCSHITFLVKQANI